MEIFYLFSKSTITSGGHQETHREVATSGEKNISQYSRDITTSGGQNSQRYACVANHENDIDSASQLNRNERRGLDFDINSNNKSKQS